MHYSADRVHGWARRVGSWTSGSETRSRAENMFLGFVLIGFALLLLVSIPPPLYVALAILFGIFLFARAWVREFYYLMRLADEVFPGHNDKLIWAILLIVAPPVGFLLFRSYRRAHWADAKPGSATDDLD
jgi:hypothetical protein